MTQNYETMQRRTFIATTATAAASIAGLSGCLSEESDESSGDANGGNGGGNGNGSTNTGTTDGGDSGGLAILEDEFYEEEYSGGVRGIVQNNTGAELSYVGVQAEFLDSEGTRIGEGLDNTTDLSSEQKWQFDAMFLGDNPEEIDSYNIEVSDSPF